MVNPKRMLTLALCGFSLLVLPSVVHAQPTVTLTVPDAMAAEAGQDPASFTVTRTTDAGTGSSLRVYMQLGGTAVRNADYTTTNLESIGGANYYTTIAVGEMSIAIAATPNLDNLIEGEETISLTIIPSLLNEDDYVIGAPNSGGATIADDVAEIHLTVDDDEAAEFGQDPAGFTITRDSHGNMGASLRVYLELGGTAVRNADYTTTNLESIGGTTYYATIPAGQPSVFATFTPVLDNLIEGEETITYSLLGPQLGGNDYTIGAPNSGGATIADDVAVVTITASDPEAAEQGPNTGTLTVARDSHGNMGASLRVYLELGGTAVRNADYTTTNLESIGGSTYYVTIPANELSQDIVITPVADMPGEGDETVILTVLEPQLGGHDYLIGAPAQAIVTIEDLVPSIIMDGFENLVP